MVWWWIGNVLLFVAVIPLVVFLATRLMRRTSEVREYAADILTHGLKVTSNLDSVPALTDTAALVGTTRHAAARYAESLSEAGGSSS